MFAGGWTLEAAEAVCVVDDDTPDATGQDVFDGLARLVEHSLVQHTEQPDGSSRFGMLETIREFALEQLQQRAETEDLSRRHAAYFLMLAEHAEVELHASQQRTWLERMETEHNNLRAALQWSVAVDPGAGATLERRAHPLLVPALPFDRGSAAGSSKLLEAGSDADVRAYARALNGAGHLATTVSRFEDAQAWHERSLALFRELDDEQGRASALSGLGRVAGFQGDFALARQLYEQSLAISRRRGDNAAIAEALPLLGLIAMFEHDYRPCPAALGGSA